MLAGITYNNKEYFYARDILGNIYGIINSSGNYIIKYDYNAYGEVTKNILALSGDDLVVANHNPFMYKGYYYDSDLECYYLKSRFYMPSICRFISPDDHSYLDYEDLRGINLYCYCYDNPVMYSDGDGTFAISIMLIGALIGAAVSFGSSVLSQSVTGDKKINWWQVALDTAIGGISGALGASGINQIGSIIVGGVLGFAGSIGGDLISSNGDWSKANVKKALLMGAVGALIGKWTGNGTQNTIAMNNAINAGKTWGSKAFLTSAKEAMLHPNSGLVLQNMYNNMAKAISKYTLEGITKVSVGVLSSTFFSNLVSWQ